MGKKIPMIGRRFGRLTVIDESGRDKYNNATWICKCDCGNVTRPISSTALRSGNTRSCGCYKIDKCAERLTTHGMSRTRLYKIWQNMNNRCYIESCGRFGRYGGRGITVCDEWRNSFESFRDWALANGYRDNLTIDRKDNDKGYSPDNCRWATRREQQNNRECSIVVEVNGEPRTLSSLAIEHGVKYHTLWRRYIRGATGPDLIRGVSR